MIAKATRSLWALSLIALLLMGTTPEPITFHAELIDPSGVAMDQFHRALERVARGEGKARIAYFGDSHVAAERMTGRIRRVLQQNFGDAGAGYVMPAAPTAAYRHARVILQRPVGFIGLRARDLADQPGHVGLSGFALRAETAPASAAMRLRPRRAPVHGTDSLMLTYLIDPVGGDVRITLGGTEVARFSTRPPQADTDVAETRLGTHSCVVGPSGSAYRVAISTEAGPVTLLGAVIENDQAGVVLDAFGIAGARAREQLRWDEALFRDQLRARRPDLIVHAYGTNEGTDDHESIDTYARTLRTVLARSRDNVPEASCLLVGPTDNPRRLGRRRFAPRPRQAEIIETQRAVAAEFGCGFIDLVALTGGPLSMIQMVEMRPAYGARDYIHFTTLGYDAIGTALAEALLVGY